MHGTPSRWSFSLVVPASLSGVRITKHSYMQGLLQTVIIISIMISNITTIVIIINDTVIIIGMIVGRQ